MGEEEEEEEELGKTEKPKGQSAEAVKPAADGRSHHRTLQRQRAGAEGWLACMKRAAILGQTTSTGHFRVFGSSKNLPGNKEPVPIQLDQHPLPPSIQ